MSAQTRAAYLDAWAAAHGGHDPRTGGRCERAWFAGMYAMGRPLAALGVAPAAVTAAAAGAAVAAPVAVVAGADWAAPVLVAASAVLDGLDGAVAALGGTASASGFVLDSLGDRLAEAAFGLALAAAGAPGGLCVAAVAAGWLQEYARARAGAAGVGEILLVTVAERPSRVIAAVAGLAGAAAGVRRGPALGAAAWAGLGAAGLAQLLPALVRTLGRPPT